MSHFYVIVAGEDIQEQLQPFHEYECTGTEDEHVVFVEADETKEELKAEYDALEPADKKAYGTFDDYVHDYHGYHFTSEGKVGRKTNPNAKWDWWSIGGRYSGRLLHKNGERVDSLLKSELDIETLKINAAERAGKAYDKVKAVVGDLTHENWTELRLRFEAEGRSIDDARTAYHAQPSVEAFKSIEGSFFDSYDDYNMSREKYVGDAVKGSYSPYAFVKDKTWHEKGEMGWFGMSSNEKDNWNEIYEQIFNDLPDDTVLTVVDCHI